MTNNLKIFIGNWKMYGDISSLKILRRINTFLNTKKSKMRPRVIMCIPSILLYPFSKYLKNSKVSFGAQNCHEIDSYGPFTGSISAKMLKKAGAKYVIIGHSENRIEGDDQKKINKKIKSAQRQNLSVIYCIGENLTQQKKKLTFKILKKQINSIFLHKINLNKLIIAYEPTWAIGSGNIPRAEELKKIFSFIKTIIKNKIKSKKIPKILYGGSVNNSNIVSFLTIKDCDGFLIGGASLSSKKFIDIIKKCYK